MSKICNKNIERDSLHATIKALSLTPELAKENARVISGLTHQLKAKSNIVSSACPLCKRVFHPGDALCGCCVVTTKSINRHALRRQMKLFLKAHRLNRISLQ